MTTRDRGDRYGPMEWAQQAECTEVRSLNFFTLHVSWVHINNEQNSTHTYTTARFAAI